MKPYLALASIDLRLALRNKSVLFFNYIFPLIFFFVLAEMMDARRRGNISHIVSMVLVFGILGNGLFGAGMRAVQDREANILRRFKVAPIGPTPILVASLVTGWVLYLPALLILMALSWLLYGMPLPDRPFALLALVSLGVIAMRALGLILAAVANSMQESNILIQMLYMPMLFLSGATIPMVLLPGWAQLLAQFLPATYLVSGLQAIFLRNESLLENLMAVSALVLMAGLALFVASQLFRWEKEERIRPSARIWVAAVLLPFVLLGAYQSASGDYRNRAQTLFRDLQRREHLLFQGPRIFVGDGTVIESGAVLVREGRIERVFEQPVDRPEPLKAVLIEAAGKTLLPGLLDMGAQLRHSPLDKPGETSDPTQTATAMERALASLLYCGITGVKTLGDPLSASLDLQAKVRDGQLLAAEPFPAGVVASFQGSRIKESPVRPLPEEYDLQAIAEACRQQGLGLWVEVKDQQELEAALEAGVDAILWGEAGSPVPAELLARMAAGSVQWIPMLAKLEARRDLLAGSEAGLKRSLVQQVASRESLQAWAMAKGKKTALDSERAAASEKASETLASAQANLLAAFRSGVPLLAAGGSGEALLFQGPSLHRELQLWVDSGVPAGAALQAVTGNAARALKAEGRIGLIREGADADLVLVDGNPLLDISATERISLVVFKGERINRSRIIRSSD